MPQCWPHGHGIDENSRALSILSLGLEDVALKYEKLVQRALSCCSLLHWDIKCHSQRRVVLFLHTDPDPWVTDSCLKRETSCNTFHYNLLHFAMEVQTKCALKALDIVVEAIGKWFIGLLNCCLARLMESQRRRWLGIVLLESNIYQTITLETVTLGSIFNLIDIKSNHWPLLQIIDQAPSNPIRLRFENG